VENYKNYNGNGMKKMVAHIDKIEDPFIDPEGDTNKIFFKTKKESVFLFKTGSIKISCKNVSDEFPETTKMLMESINSVTSRILEIIQGVKITEPKISMMNAQTKLKEFPDPKKFAKVVEPNIQRKGWRVFRYYVFSGRKFHLAVDKHKRCQIFAAKSIEEIKEKITF
tara:strand:+ start:186 stop:689 length:504 start_codon:yes stop_codon:yes gene_type:complete